MAPAVRLSSAAIGPTAYRPDPIQQSISSRERSNAVCGALAVDKQREGRELMEDPVVECSSCPAAAPPPC